MSSYILVGLNASVSVSQEYLAWLKQPKLLQSPEVSWVSGFHNVFEVGIRSPNCLASPDNNVILFGRNVGLLKAFCHHLLYV